jgi:hypothetical protein
MKLQMIISLFLFLTFCACGENRTPETGKQDTPKALEDKSSEFRISKRGHNDLVESLYEELAGKTPELKQLEGEINILNESRADSTETFIKFDEKNQDYFHAADRHVEEIKDSVLRDKMKVLIANNLSAYNLLVSSHTGLLKSINQKYLVLGDLHTVLKIVRTLPVIEKYQNDNLPTKKPLEGLARQLDATIKHADTLSKK